MSLSKDEIIDAIAEMSVMDVVELVDAMEDKFGVTAAAAVNGQLLDRQMLTAMAAQPQKSRLSSMFR